MAHVVDQDTCTFCTSCMEVCPVSAISEKNDKAFIDADICIDSVSYTHLTLPTNSLV